jgi:hypothetical protein
MAKIQPVDYPFGEVATDLIVYVQGFKTDVNTCRINYYLVTDIGKQLLQGDYELTEEEFQGWGEDNSYIDAIAAAKIGVTIVPDNQ